MLGEAFSLICTCDVAGHHCPLANTKAMPCKKGTFCVLGAASEVPCPAGTVGEFEMLKEEEECRVCTAGHACLAGSSEELRCPRGTWSLRRAKVCIDCPAGSYQDQRGRSACQTCPRGHSCGSSAVAPTPLLAGTWSNRSALHNASEAELCPEGFYCVSGSSTPQPCAAGTAGRQLGLGGAEFCSVCARPTTSVQGSSECSDCEENYYRPLAASDAAKCTQCDAVRGLRCQYNATMASLTLARRWWRHSNATMQTWLCRASGSWTPCAGGTDTKGEGDGYCADGYRGPRCELCEGPAYSRYFDKLEARCHDCGDMTARYAVLVCVMLLLLLAGATGGMSSSLRSSAACGSLLQLIRTAQTIWQRAGMRYKIKLLVGFYQCLAAVRSVFNMVPPLGLEEYLRWIDLLELPSEFERIFLVPIACLGNYRTRLWVGSTWPVVLILACAVCLIGLESVRAFRQRDDRTLSTPRRVQSVLQSAMRGVLPPTLGLTFLVVPSTSTRIFRAFLCETFAYDQESSRSYLYADLRLSCDSDEYETTRATAFAMLVLWPVGIPLLYAVLLWASRDALRKGVPTSLSRATAFLSGDYRSDVGPIFMWEPLEMCRKLTLTGWVLTIRGNAELARVIVALFVSISFFGLNLRFRPLRE